MDNIELVVLHHFDGYVRGDVISDIAKIQEILTGPHGLDVIKRKWIGSVITESQATPVSEIAQSPVPVFVKS